MLLQVHARRFGAAALVRFSSTTAKDSHVSLSLHDTGIVFMELPMISAFDMPAVFGNEFTLPGSPRFRVVFEDWLLAQTIWPIPTCWSSPISSPWFGVAS
jgi:hypothetical protein